MSLHAPHLFSFRMESHLLPSIKSVYVPLSITSRFFSNILLGIGCAIIYYFYNFILILIQLKLTITFGFHQQPSLLPQFKSIGFPHYLYIYINSLSRLLTTYLVLPSFFMGYGFPHLLPIYIKIILFLQVNNFISKRVLTFFLYLFI